MKKTLLASSVVLAFSLLQGCGGGGSSTPPAADSTQTTPTSAPSSAPTQDVSGVGVDGYIAGAMVFLDLNNNGVADGGEPSTTTDGQGNYTLAGISLLPGQTLASSQLVLTGGTDTGTGKPFVGSMTAKPDANNPSANITPLTTLANAMITSGAATSLTDATEKLSKVLGVSTSNVLSDPMTVAAQDPAILQKAVAMQKAIEVLAAAEAGTSTDATVKANAANNAAKAIAQAVSQASFTVNGSDTSTLPSVATLVQSAVNTNSSSFINVAAVQAVSQAAQQMATITENTIAATVATLVANNQLNASLSSADVANLVQTEVNGVVAAFAGVQESVIQSATTAQTEVASNPAAVLTATDKVPANLLSAATAALTQTTITVKTSNATESAASLIGLAVESGAIKVELPSVAPTVAPTIPSDPGFNSGEWTNIPYLDSMPTPSQPEIRTLIGADYLSWVLPNARGVRTTEIYMRNNYNNGSVVGSVSGSGFVSYVTPGTTNYYKIRFISETGEIGGWSAEVEVSAAEDPSVLIDAVQSEINNSELAQSLRNPITVR